MTETLAWSEGRIAFWTGTATASAILAYATDSRVTPFRGWENRQTLGLTYYDLLTGRRADLSVGLLYTTDNKLMQFFENESALVHVHLSHEVQGQGSAGMYLYSGRIDSLSLNGIENKSYQYQLAYHCNLWSAYGT